MRISVHFSDRATTIYNRVRLEIHLGLRMAPESRQAGSNPKVRFADDPGGTDCCRGGLCLSAIILAAFIEDLFAL